MTKAPGIRLAGTLTVVPGHPVSVDLTLVAGGWTCLLGSSGVGKSTLLRLIAGLPTGVPFEGVVTTSDEAPLETQIAYMAQDDLLAPWLDVTGNVALGARLRGDRPDSARASRLIASTGLSDHATKRPAQLSGGMRQRVALARTLMEDRPVALLDEPFSALDARTRIEMQDLAFSALAGRTVLIVTHDPGEAARLGHRIVLMTEAGLSDVAIPTGPPIRPATADATLRAQADLLTRLCAV